MEFGFGGAKGSRTPDLLHAMQALSQLSYGPIRVGCAARPRSVWQPGRQFKRNQALGIVVFACDIGNIVQRNVVVFVVIL